MKNTNRNFGVRALSGICVYASLFVFAACGTEPVLPTMLEGIGVDEKVGRNIDLDLTFIDETGYPVPLRTYFSSGKPVILNLVYYKCPMLCNMVLNAQTQALRDIPWTPGNEFEIVTISIDPQEGFDLAQQKKKLQLGAYDRPAPGWHFLVDHENHTKRLAEAIGFHYRYDERIEQYAHAAAIMILTPEGKVSRYLYGVKFKQRDLRLALTEAAEGKGKFSIEKLLLFCYHYDPQSRSYTLFATNIMRGGGVLTLLIFGTVLFRFWKKDRQKSLTEGNLVPAK
jgi:protein SCO1/2